MKTKTILNDFPKRDLNGNAIDMLRLEIAVAVENYLKAANKKHGKVMVCSDRSIKDIVIDLDEKPYTSFSVAVSIDIGEE